MSHCSTSMEPYRSLSSSVHIGDDSTLHVVGMGGISLGDAVLHDVLHVPKISTNLLSISKATSKGLSVYFDDEVIEVVDRST